MDSYNMILFPAIFLSLFQFVFTGFAPDDSLVDDYIDAVMCEWPDYNNGIDASVITCSIIDHPTAYASENSFGFPIGWYTFTADVVTSAFYRVGSVLVIVSLVLFPIADFGTILPDEVVTIFIGAFVFLYIMIIVGAYKVISPFVGR